MSHVPRPPRWQEKLGSRLVHALAPRIRQGGPTQPSEHFAPFEHFEIPRRNRLGHLAAIWYPATGEPRGAVLLAHPWIQVAQGYFLRQGRLEALRSRGFHAMTFDLGGLGASPPPAGFYDQDLTAALGALRQRAGDLPRYFWGVSAGGYWAHLVLRDSGIRKAMFEDVSPHLLEWSWRMVPRSRPAYLVFRYGLRQAYNYLDARKHAPHLGVAGAAYVGGEKDRGVPPQETRRLAELADGKCRIVPKAGHLASIKLDRKAVLDLALETFQEN